MIVGNEDSSMLAFTSREAQRLTGLSTRRLQYWDETDFVRPSVAARQGRGSPRLYSFRDIVQLRVAALLRDRLSLQALRRLKASLDVDAPFATVRFAILPGNQVVYLRPTGAPESVKRPGQIVMVLDVPLEEVRVDLEQRIRSLRARHGAGSVARRRGVAGGQPTFAGTRIPLSTVNRLITAGWSQERILREFPDLRDADLQALERDRTLRRAGAQAKRAM